MRKRVYILLASVVLGGGVFLSLHGREPSYEGRSLSSWIIEMRNGKEKEKARAVVHRLGKNSIPLLLEWLQRPDGPTLKGRFWEARNGVIGWLEGHRLMTRRPRISEMDWRGSYRSLADGVFDEMGPDGKEAIPTLIEWLGKRSNNPEEFSVLAGEAYCILGRIGPAPVPALINALSNPDWQVSALAAGALGNIGLDARAAIPALEKKLDNTNLFVRLNAADAIGKLGGDPAKFMPVVVEALRDPDLEYLDFKLGFLLRYKGCTKDAFPVLLELLRNTPDDNNQTNRFARQQLVDALQEIGPEGLREAQEAR